MHLNGFGMLTAMVALSSIIEMVVHVVMEMVIVIKVTESPYGLRLTTYDCPVISFSLSLSLSLSLSHELSMVVILATGA